MLGLQAEALADFEQAAAAAPDSSFTHFFVGQENLFLAEAAAGEAASAFDAAAEAAFKRAPDNARAQIGLGSVHLLRAQRQLNDLLDSGLSGDDKKAALDSVIAEAEQALALYEGVVAGGSQIETYGVPVDLYASYGAAISQRLLGEVAFEQRKPGPAEQLIDEAESRLTAIMPLLESVADFRLHAQVYQALGSTYEWQSAFSGIDEDAAGRDEATQNARDAYTRCLAVGDAFPLILMW
ncbi:MAG: hypothetical protein M5U34_40465 [Chloroflexi bacterium]|nr:hypothetical protein [Chloroflexota bacterium]